MKSNRLLGCVVLFASCQMVQGFVAHHTAIATTRKLQSGPLFLHVEALHPHRDSIVRLDDPIVEPADARKVDHDKRLHSFTNHLAPLVLALYLVGHYLSNHDTSVTSLVDGTRNINVDPMFGGYVLIGSGLLMIKWSIDNAFLSPA